MEQLFIYYFYFFVSELLAIAVNYLQNSVERLMLDNVGVYVLCSDTLFSRPMCSSVLFVSMFFTAQNIFSEYNLFSMLSVDYFYCIYFFTPLSVLFLCTTSVRLLLLVQWNQVMALNFISQNNLTLDIVIIALKDLKDLIPTVRVCPQFIVSHILVVIKDFFGQIIFN